MGTKHVIVILVAERTKMQFENAKANTYQRVKDPLVVILWINESIIHRELE
jgi:hypothetical protein